MTTETNTVFNSVKEAFAPVTDALKNLQNMEVPEAARDFVKRTANTAKERAADVYAGSEKVTAVIETAVADSVSEAADGGGFREGRDETESRMQMQQRFGDRKQRQRAREHQRRLRLDALELGGALRVAGRVEGEGG